MIEGFWKSCYDFRWLLSRKDAPMGKVLAHLGVLVALLTAARVAAFGPMLNKMIDTGAEFVSKEMPEVAVTNGRTSCDAPQPWKRSFEGQFQIIIDTTGQSQSIEAAYPTGVLIGPDKVYYKRSPDMTQAIELTKVQSFSTRGPKMAEWIAEIRAWVYPVLVPLAAGVSAAGLAFRWLIVAALAYWLAGPLGAPLGWEQVVRIGAYSVTPAVYFILLGTLTPLSVALVPTLAQIFFLGLPLWMAKEEAEAAAGGSTNGYHKPPTG